MEKNIDELLETLFKTEEKLDIELDPLMKYSYFISDEIKKPKNKLKVLAYICIFLLISNILLIKFFPTQKNSNSKNEEIKYIAIKTETKYRNKTANDEEITLPLQNFFEEMNSFIEFTKSPKNYQKIKNGG